VEYIDIKKNEAFLVTQKAFIIKQNKFLILQNPQYKNYDWSKKWTLPGGILELNETLQDGLLREIEEETGKLKVKIKHPIAVSQFTHPNFKFRDGRAMEIEFITIGYLCEYISGEIKLSDEHIDFKWVSKKEVKKYNISKDSKELVKEFINSVNNLV